MGISGRGGSKGYTPVKNTSGETKYIGGYFGSSGMPSTIQKTVQISNTSAGIWLGEGQTPATEEDYTLEEKITSGLTAGTATIRSEVDENGNPYIEYTFMLSNTTAEDIIIREIGFVQQFNMSSTIGGATSQDKLLIDRTVLSVPVTVPANGEAVMRYTLKTIKPA